MPLIRISNSILSSSVLELTNRRPDAPAPAPGPGPGPGPEPELPNWQIIIFNNTSNQIEVADVKLYNDSIDVNTPITLESNNFPTQPNQLPLVNFIGDGSGNTIGIVNSTSNMNQLLTMPGQVPGSLYSYGLLNFRADSDDPTKFNPIAGENMTVIKKKVGNTFVDAVTATAVYQGSNPPLFIDPDPLPGSYELIVYYQQINR